jgi:hypothetical protein
VQLDRLSLDDRPAVVVEPLVERDRQRMSER